MRKEEMIGELKSSAEYFNRSSKCLEESNSSFVPKEGMFTVAIQVAHVAQTIDWFFEGAFDPKGFDMDFEKHMTAVADCTSLEAARQWYEKSVRSALEAVESKSEEDWHAPMAQGPVMGGLPRYSIIGAIAEHTAHHRGALAVYSRLLGKVPPMPYMDPQ